MNEMNFSQLMSLAGGHVEARIVQTALELRIFDALGDKSKSAEAISQALGLEAKATELLLNALAAINLLEKQASLFSLADVSKQYLLSSSPRYVGGMIHFDASLWSCWEKLKQALPKAKIAWDRDSARPNRRKT